MMAPMWMQAWRRLKQREAKEELPVAPFVGRATMGEMTFAVLLGSDDGVHFRRRLLAELADTSLVGSVGFRILGALR